MTDLNVSSEPVKYNPDFAKEIYALESGEHVKLCMQCGMCALSCATREEMDYSPRKLFLLMRVGKREEFFKANTMWMCSTCLMCKVRCPRGIPLADVMHDLKSHAIKLGYTERPQATFYQSFWQEILNKGRVFEGGLMARYYLKRGWSEMTKGLFEMRDLGMTMLKHNRMPLKSPKSIKGLKSMKQIIERAQAQMHREEGR
ncbi:MAG: heterodisulfide reductase subunit C [Peptococcaceae bacterium BRH_c4a]|nr:MAG: heterodisulfide reductase subunit C [Peptococcaceae bacterium BRH_c4a]